MARTTPARAERERAVSVEASAGAHHALLLLLLTLAALALRGAALLLTVDVPGDGPSRATIAYEWTRHPYLATSGGWPPGFMYLAGIVGLGVRDPLLASRLLNVLLGTLTVPALYSLVRGIFGATAAWFSAILLVVFPLHVGVSASSLTETSFLFEVVAGLELLRRAAAASRHRAPLLAGAICCFVLGEMTRYETWPLVAPLPMYLYLKTGARRTAIIFGLALALFPLAWTWSNAVHAGDAFVGFTAATTATALGESNVGFVDACSVIAVLAGVHLGWLMLAAVAAGLLLEMGSAMRAPREIDRLLYLAVAGIYWITMLRFAMVRGESLYNRYLLFGFVISAPFAVVPFLRSRRSGPGVGSRLWLRAAVLAVVTLLMTRAADGTAEAWPRTNVTTWITMERPVAIERFAAWLAGTPYATSSIMATEMRWQSTYLPLYHRALGDHYVIVSEWHQDDFLRGFVGREHPALLITADGDEHHTARIERILGVTIGAEQLVYEADGIRAYALARAGYAGRASN